MKLCRLTKSRYLMIGQGAKEAGGRWNSVGTAMVYTSEATSLTMLETLVHLHAANLLDSFTLLSVDVPDTLIQVIEKESLPQNWAAPEAPAALANIGDQWVRRGEAVSLRIPSALSPVEYNYLLSPAHPEYVAIVSQAIPVDFHFDERLK
ncbi:RES family NAD+ phosphorylase [Buttiauxella gaviniae]|uniref:RES family NAD+ phosphorylase n=1 Tax=Buttiauxella gaviniae TaxID=82990 RepID=UPI0007E3BD10|nr:RES family NAD+ phosphorylase [Buttiauxella gaviniae]